MVFVIIYSYFLATFLFYYYFSHLKNITAKNSLSSRSLLSFSFIFFKVNYKFHCEHKKVKSRSLLFFLEFLKSLFLFRFYTNQKYTLASHTDTQPTHSKSDKHTATARSRTDTKRFVFVVLFIFLKFMLLYIIRYSWLVWLVCH